MIILNCYFRQIVPPSIVAINWIDRKFKRVYRPRRLWTIEGLKLWGFSKGTFDLTNWDKHGYCYNGEENSEGQVSSEYFISPTKSFYQALSYIIMLEMLTCPAGFLTFLFTHFLITHGFVLVGDCADTGRKFQSKLVLKIIVYRSSTNKSHVTFSIK